MPVRDKTGHIVRWLGTNTDITEQVRVDGPIRFEAANGYRINTTDALVDLKTRRMASGGGVTGTVPQGSFSANRLRADLEARTVTLQGNARLRIQPRGPR